MALSRKKRQIEPEKAKGSGSNGRLVTAANPTSARAEAYRTLRANLMYRFVDAPPNVVVITSPGRNEGKTTTCANLGVVLSQAGKNTLIIDCDLRQPNLHKACGLRNLYGLVDVLGGEMELDEACHAPMTGLKVLTAGPVPPNSAEILASRRFAEFMDQIRMQYEYVLVDTPPVQLVADATVVAAHGDGALLVLDAQKTRKSTVRQAVRSLEAVGSRVLGTVMNNTKVPRGASYDYVYEA